MRDIGGNKMGENVTETKLRVANPAALGLMGLAVVTFVACSQKLGLTEGYEGLLPWAFFLGGFAQIIASGIEFKRENTFCATAFGAYGLFWFAIGMTWYNGSPNIEQLGFAILGYLIFNTYMLYGAAALNKGLFAVFLFIELLFFTLLLNFQKRFIRHKIGNTCLNKTVAGRYKEQGGKGFVANLGASF